MVVKLQQKNPSSDGAVVVASRVDPELRKQVERMLYETFHPPRKEISAERFPLLETIESDLLDVGKNLLLTQEKGPVILESLQKATCNLYDRTIGVEKEKRYYCSQDEIKAFERVHSLLKKVTEDARAYNEGRCRNNGHNCWTVEGLKKMGKYKKMPDLTIGEKLYEFFDAIRKTAELYERMRWSPSAGATEELNNEYHESQFNFSLRELGQLAPIYGRTCVIK